MAEARVSHARHGVHVPGRSLEHGRVEIVQGDGEACGWLWLRDRNRSELKKLNKKAIDLTYCTQGKGGGGGREKELCWVLVEG